jgi:hypothetical protein
MIVKSEYSPSGYAVVNDRPERPAPTEADFAAAQKADRLTYSAFKREYDITDEDFPALQALGFPDRLGWASDRQGRSQQSLYSRSQIETFRARILSAAAKLR